MQTPPSWLAKLGHAVWGAPRCVLCHETTSGHDGLCPGCRHDLRLLYTDAAHRCPTCTRFSRHAHVCGHCQQKPPPLARLFTGCDYSAPLKQMLHAFKHQRQSSLLPALSTLMLHHPPPWLPEAPIDAVLAMPLSAPRLAERGFNQSQLLARRIATAYGWPLLDKGAVLRQHRPPQSTLSRDKRRQNVRGVFRVAADVKNCNLLLIDDVVTTGATIYELAQSLKRAGAAAVYAWALAHPQ